MTHAVVLVQSANNEQGAWSSALRDARSASTAAQTAAISLAAERQSGRQGKFGFHPFGPQRGYAFPGSVFSGSTYCYI